MAIRAGLALHTFPTTIHLYTSFTVRSFVPGPVCTCTDTHTHTHEYTKMNGATGGFTLNPLWPISTSFLSTSRPRKFPTRFPRKLPSRRQPHTRGNTSYAFSSWEPRERYDEGGKWKDGPMIEFPSLEVEWWMQSKVEFRGLFPLRVIWMNCILKECSLSLKLENFNFYKLYDYSKILIPKLILIVYYYERSRTNLQITRFKVISSSLNSYRFVIRFVHFIHSWSLIRIRERENTHKIQDLKIIANLESLILSIWATRLLNRLHETKSREIETVIYFTKSLTKYYKISCKIETQSVNIEWKKVHYLDFKVRHLYFCSTEFLPKMVLHHFEKGE